MNKSDYSKIGLYNHNIKSYEKIKSAFESGEKIVGIVHATGTGKTYNALQLAYDNQDKKTLFIVPSNSIKEHIIKTIKDNPNLNLETDFKNLQFITYQSIAQMNDEEFANLAYDYLIIDEFHHLGAPIWGPKINKIIQFHPDKYVLGMTAYTVRERGTDFERDMANPDTEELFSNKIVSTYDLVDAMIDGILPKPIYRSAYINLEGFINDIEARLERIKISDKTYKDFRKVLEDIKRRIHNAPSVEEIFKQNLKLDGKYIYFCPQGGINGINDIDTIMKETKEQLEKCFPGIEIIFYKTTSKDGELGKKNRDAFYNDYDLNGTSTKGKLRIMFAINQYNEGVHAPNIDGVIMGRSTKSDIVFFEQLGRALSVRENIKELKKELDKYCKEELIVIAARRKIETNLDMTKEEIIEKLLSPVVIDLTNNYEYIKELENNLKDRVREIQLRYESIEEQRTVKITNTIFDIDIINQDLFEMLKKLRNKLAPMTWDAWYEMAKAYYKYYGNIKVKESFKTFNGVDQDENGLRLSSWINNQKVLYKKGKLSKERMEKLEAIGIFPTNNLKRLTWDEWYDIASAYYNHYGNLEVPRDFRTLNGIDYDPKGRFLYNWLIDQARLPANIRWEYIFIEYEKTIDGKPISKRELSRRQQKFEELKDKWQKLIAINYEGFYEYKSKRKPRKKQ